MRKRQILSYIAKHSDEIWKDADSIPYIDEKDIPNVPSFAQEKKAKKKFYQCPSFMTAAACACLIVVFFLTPPGQTFAKSLYTTVINWITDASGTTVEIQHGIEAPPEIDNNIPLSEHYEYTSLEEVPAEFQRGIAVHSSLLPSSITIDIPDISCDDYMVQETFEIHDGSVLVSTMFSSADISYSGVYSTDTGVGISTTTSDKLEISGVFDNNAGNAAGFYNNISITFNSEGISLDDFIAFINATSLKPYTSEK